MITINDNGNIITIVDGQILVEPVYTKTEVRAANVGILKRTVAVEFIIKVNGFGHTAPLSSFARLKIALSKLKRSLRCKKLIISVTTAIEILL